MFFSQDTFREIALQEGHSEEFISECIKYAFELEKKGLPIIFSTHHLGVLLDINSLNWIIQNRVKFYKFYQIRKKNGTGYRQIVAPYRNLKEIQSFILNEILSKVIPHPQSNGFVKGRSILNNAQPHVNAPAILNIDLMRFFDTISERRVYGVFKSLGYAKELCVTLAKLTTIPLPDEYLAMFSEKELAAFNKVVREGEAVLPQGAPTSPALSNYILYRLDNKLTALAKKRGIQYSRYADDLTFSGDLIKLPKISSIRRIINQENLFINWSKVGIYKKGRKQLVNGLTVSDGVHIHRDFKKEVSKHIYCCLKFGVEEHKKYLKLENTNLYKEWLLGKICFIKSIEPTTGNKLESKFNEILWPA